jgi:hypothetical protein
MTLEAWAIIGPMPEKDLAGWKFEVDEVSAGVWRGRGVDHAGRSVEASGTDYDALLARLKQSAREIADDVPSTARWRKPQD